MTRRTLFHTLLGMGAGTVAAKRADATPAPTPPSEETVAVVFHTPPPPQTETNGRMRTTQHGQCLITQTPTPSVAAVKLAVGGDGYLWIRQHGQWTRVAS